MKFVDSVLASVAGDGLTLEVEDLSVVCDRTTTALRDVSAKILPGEFVGIEGVNGSGKSTLANVLIGLGGRSLAVSGAVRYNGHDIYGAKVTDRQRTKLRAQLISFVPKVPTLDSSLTVRQNLVRPSLLTGRLVDHSRLKDLIALFELERYVNSPTRELSSGFQQRVNIVRGLLPHVAVTVLDEPTDALDPEQKLQVLDLLARATDRTIIIVSHERTGARRSIRLNGGVLA